MKFALTIGIFLICQVATGQAKPGFYITTDLNPDVCSFKMKLINTETIHCLADEPVIEVHHIKKVGNMVYDSISDIRGFNIVLSKKGDDFVRSVAENLSHNKLALVINGILVSTIALDDLNTPDALTIWDYKNSKSIDWVHKSLVDRVSRYQKKS